MSIKLSKQNLFISISAAIGALWGRLHGGANQKVIEMLNQIKNDGGDYKKYVKYNKIYDRPSEVASLLGNYSKAKIIIKCKPKTSFKKGIRLTFNWYRNNKSYYKSI